MPTVPCYQTSRHTVERLGLNVLDSDGLHLKLTEPLRPGVVRPTEESDYYCVLMPMQVV